MRMETWKRAVVGAAALALATACETTKTEEKVVQVTAPASTYLVEYLPGMMDAAVGKSTFQLRVKKRSDDSAATGLSISVMPVMYMATMNHSAPMDPVAESTTPGTYNGAIYYLMMSGVGMGYWELRVSIGSESVSFYPSVGMAMGGDTVKVNLWSAPDQGPTLQATNKYILFRDGALSAAAHSFKLFITRSKDVMMGFDALTATGFAQGTPSLTASADAAFTTPLAATHTSNGHWTVDVASLNPVDGTPLTVYVKLAVAADPKTTDGLPVSGANAYAQFKVTPTP